MVKHYYHYLLMMADYQEMDHSNLLKVEELLTVEEVLLLTAQVGQKLMWYLKIKNYLHLHFRWLMLNYHYLESYYYCPWL
jgi:hypothetical protein